MNIFYLNFAEENPADFFDAEHDEDRANILQQQEMEYHSVKNSKYKHTFTEGEKKRVQNQLPQLLEQELKKKGIKSEELSNKREVKYIIFKETIH